MIIPPGGAPARVSPDPRSKERGKNSPQRRLCPYWGTVPRQCPTVREVSPPGLEPGPTPPEHHEEYAPMGGTLSTNPAWRITHSGGVTPCYQEEDAGT